MRFILLLLLLAQNLPAQTKASDLLVFTNGDQLTGSLTRADATGVTFQSSMAGEITAKWATIKELRSDRDFAVLSTHQKLTRKNAAAVLPQGRIHVQGNELTVASSASSVTIPVTKTQQIVDATSFDQAVNHPPGLLHGWSGTASAGASLVRATENSTSFNGSLGLIRSTPQVNWLPPRDRTTLEYTQSYGTVSQRNSPVIETNIFHAAGERDEYFSPRLFAFVSATFDHNFSQSLDLQQAYGGGLGITFLKNAVRQLDFKGDAHYEEQRFFDASQNQSLFGSTFSEKYLQYLPKGLVFNEFGSISPSWNNTNAYSAHVNASFGFPIYKGLGFALGGVDDYLHNAPAGFKKNSTQFTTGLTYAIKPR